MRSEPILTDKNPSTEAVGIVIISRKTGRFLLLHRVHRPIVWSLLTGSMDVKGESPLDTIKREIEEEIRINSNEIQNITKVGVTKLGKKFHVFMGFVDDEFKPNLKLDENNDYGWFTPSTLPTPLHPEWQETYDLIRPYLSVKESILEKINKILTESEDDDLDWIREIPPSFPLNKGRRIIINACESGYDETLVKSKLQQLFTEEELEGVYINWFDNEHIVKVNHKCILIIYFYTHFRFGWDECGTLEQHVGYSNDYITVDEFLRSTF
jgi:8-oxo-dGTP pyrophosphatase MutT (NUDIX family)